MKLRNLRPKNVLLLALVVVMVNLPLAHTAWQNHRIEADGVDVVATVTDHEQDGESRVLAFEADGTPSERPFEGLVRVDQETYDEAVRTGVVGVRALYGEEAVVWNVEGEQTSRVGLVITLLADLFLLVMVLLLMRFGSKLRSELVLVATQDLERCPPGSVLDRIDGLRYVVCGEVHEIEDGEVVLDLGDRWVRVILDGFHNPAGYQQPVRATGTMVA